jgi:hypothetical protein
MPRPYPYWFFLARLGKRTVYAIAPAQAYGLGDAYAKQHRICESNRGRLHAEIHGGMKADEYRCSHPRTCKNRVSPTSKHAFQAREHQH